MSTRVGWEQQKLMLVYEHRPGKALSGQGTCLCIAGAVCHHGCDLGFQLRALNRLWGNDQVREPGTQGRTGLTTFRLGPNPLKCSQCSLSMFTTTVGARAGDLSPPIQGRPRKSRAGALKRWNISGSHSYTRATLTTGPTGSGPANTAQCSVVLLFLCNLSKTSNRGRNKEWGTLASLWQSKRGP